MTSHETFAFAAQTDSPKMDAAAFGVDMSRRHETDSKVETAAATVGEPKSEVMNAAATEAKTVEPAAEGRQIKSRSQSRDAVVEKSLEERKSIVREGIRDNYRKYQGPVVEPCLAQPNYNEDKYLSTSRAKCAPNYYERKPN